jgi:iron complex transport system ATP-binding protein
VAPLDCHAIHEAGAGPRPVDGDTAVVFTGVTVTGWDARAGAARNIVRDVDWRVGRGEHWAILGPNGAGKTTVLGAARGTVRPSRGSIRILGSALATAGLSNPLHHVGVIESTPPRFAQRISALEAVLTRTSGSVALRGSRVREPERRRAIELLIRFGCLALADRRYADCSRGERQRILLARALMRDPALLLFDEPTIGLDLPGREAFLQALDRLATDQRDLATVTVTHHVEEIPSSVTHALLLRAGVVVDAGPVDEVMSPASLSECFGHSVSVSRRDGRWAARITDPSW